MGQAGDRVTVRLRHDNLSPRRKHERPFALRSQMCSTREESYFCLLVYSSESTTAPTQVHAFLLDTHPPVSHPQGVLAALPRAGCRTRSVTNH